MEYDNTYQAKVRLADDTLGLEIWETNRQGHIQTDNYFLRDAKGVTLGTSSFRFDHELNTEKYGTNLMPTWWEPKSPAKVEKLSEQFAKTGIPIPTTNNVVTFAMYRDNGAMMGQLRSFVSPKGQPIGNPGMPSMHGGMIDDEDLQPNPDDYIAGQLYAVLREIYEEFGVELATTELKHLGNVYDPDNSRFNHVYATNIGYETALKRTYNLEGPAVDAMLAAIFDCEGVGRITNMFAADAHRAIEINAFTPISIKILKALPSLIPVEKPA